MQAFDRSLDGKLGASLGDVFHGTFAPPGAVDAHHVRREAAFEHHPLALAPFTRHVAAPDLARGCTRRSRSKTTERPLTDGKSGQVRTMVIASVTRVSM